MLFLIFPRFSSIRWQMMNDGAFFSSPPFHTPHRIFPISSIIFFFFSPFSLLYCVFDFSLSGASTVGCRCHDHQNLFCLLLSSSSSSSSLVSAVRTSLSPLFFLLLFQAETAHGHCTFLFFFFCFSVVFVIDLTKICRSTITRWSSSFSYNLKVFLHAR